MRSERAVEMALHEAGLALHEPRIGIDRNDAIHVLGEIEHQRRVAGLAGETGADSARQNRHRVFPRNRDGSEHLALMARDDDADWRLPIVRSAGRLPRARAGEEAYFAFELATEFNF